LIMSEPTKPLRPHPEHIRETRRAKRIGRAPPSALPRSCHRFEPVTDPWHLHDISLHQDGRRRVLVGVARRRGHQGRRCTRNAKPPRSPSSNGRSGGIDKRPEIHRPCAGSTSHTRLNFTFLGSFILGSCIFLAANSCRTRTFRFRAKQFQTLR